MLYCFLFFVCIFVASYNHNSGGVDSGPKMGVNQQATKNEVCRAGVVSFDVHRIGHSR